MALTFAGEFQHSVDSKGRLALPARFRAKLEGGAFSYDLDGLRALVER